MFLLKKSALALMVPKLREASFCAGVRHKRYSGQQESAPSFDYAQDDNNKNDTARNKNINKLKYLK
ncbi:hypothetical protein B0A72_17655 [Flavobacterium pectinovorum]|uniref:Uncharacterized protein n=1 Tax=Flavobacterium pectinovorum TaxID=29533 RepID=A0AB36NXR3_9FLAO|nr:hypothetical protein B0A72_17655 [Flavobacterium pectinovorum]